MTRENWEVVRLGDRIQCNPQTKLQKGEEYDFLPMENIKTGCYKFPVGYEKKINNSGGAKFQNGDTVFARITPCLQNGKICKIQGIEKGFGSTEYFVFRAIEGVTDSDYVFYLMCHPYIRDLAEKSMVGASGRQRANVVVIENLEISLPPLAEQQRIASILSAYDDLIENNTRRIALLEQMAQTLYRQWFVEYKFPGYQDIEMVDSETEFGMIPHGWEVKRIGEVVDLLGGFAFKSTTYLDKGNYGIVTIKNVQDGKFIDNCDYIDELPIGLKDYQKLGIGDVLLSLTGNVGRVCLIYRDGYLLNQRVAKLQPKKESYQGFVYYMFRDNNMFQRLDLLSKGVAQKNLSPVETAQLSIVLPYENVLIDFNQHSNIDQILNLQRQNQSLKEQRDILLRKLIG